MSELKDDPELQPTDKLTSSVAGLQKDPIIDLARVITIKRKLVVGFGGLIVLIVFNIVINMLELRGVEERAISVIEHRYPITIQFLKFSDELNLATTHLNGYLLTGLKEYKRDYLQLEKNIQQQFTDIHQLEKAGEIDFDSIKLRDFNEAMHNFFQFASRLIHLRDNESENYPGLALANKFLLPNATGYLDLSSQLIREAQDEPPSQQQQRIISILSDIRYSWQQMMNAIRLYFNTRNESVLINMELYDQLNLQRLEELKSMNIDIGFNGLEELEAYSEAWHEQLPEVIELFRDDAWRADAYLMKTEVRPVVEQLRTILFELSRTQISASKADGETLTHHLRRIRQYSGLILFITLILGVTLAVMLSHSIIPPIQKLMQASKRVANGDLNSEVMVSRFDEVGQLTQSFNSMIQDLRAAAENKQRYLKEVESLNQQLEKRVETKIEELKSTQSQLLQSEKLASIGQLAAGVAHEINNPVGYINSNISTLKQYLKDLFRVLDGYEQIEKQVQGETIFSEVKNIKDEVDLSYLKEDIEELMDESQEGVTRVKQIVQDLKDFSHVDEAEWQWADLHKGLDSTLNVAHNETKYKAEIIKQYGDIPHVKCMPSQINQVFMNLIVNAAHAIEKRGLITISTRSDEVSVYIAIADTGKGMSEDVLKRIFDPFYTTKPIGKGTGLGLSLSYGIIEKHNGQIKVESEVGSGTTFTIVLPVEQDKVKKVDK